MSDIIEQAAPTVAGESAPLVTESAPVIPPDNVSNAATPVEKAAADELTKEAAPEYNRYEKSLEKLMANARDTRRKSQEEATQRAALEFQQKIQTAAQYGPDAVLKALGVEQKKMDLSAILGEEETGEAPYIKELRKKVNDLDDYRRQQQELMAQRQQQEQQSQVQAWERNEKEKIDNFLATNKEKYEFTATLMPCGSTNDIYGGIINMYQQGYTPSYDDMTELVENRIEDLLDRLAQTNKFKTWAASRLKTQSVTKAQSAPTLKGTLNADSVASVPPENETDEENRLRALKAAYAAAEYARKKQQAAEGQ